MNALVEELLTLQEKLPLLGQSQLESCEVDLLLVGLDRREVRVHREVGRGLRCHGISQVETNGPGQRLPLLRLRKRVGDELMAPTRRRDINTDEVTGLRHAAPVIDRTGPVAAFERAPPAPSEVDPPGRVLPRRVL